MTEAEIKEIKTLIKQEVDKAILEMRTEINNGKRAVMEECKKLIENAPARFGR